MKEDLREKVKNIGLKIKAARIEQGYSQHELGKLVGLTHACIGSYERGRLRVSASAIHKLAEILKKPVSYFYDEDPSLYEKFKKLDAVPKYDLKDNLEFSMEMSIKNYLRGNRVDNVDSKLIKIMQFISEEISK